MKARLILFRATAFLVFLQLALGGLLTFDLITPAAHIATGIVVLIVAIATMVVSLTSKPSFRPAQFVAMGLVALIVIQGILGFVALDTDNQVIAWVHLVTALAIYGMSVAGTFMAAMWDRMSSKQLEATPEPRA